MKQRNVTAVASLSARCPFFRHVHVCSSSRHAKEEKAEQEYEEDEEEEGAKLSDAEVV